MKSELATVRVLWLQRMVADGWLMWVSEPCLPPGKDGVRPEMPEIVFVAREGHRVRFERRTRQTGPFVRAWVERKGETPNSKTQVPIKSQGGNSNGERTTEAQRHGEEESPFL